ncbi:MAG: tetratricopeptide repeat protein, partial [Roseimicrobium sp.]
HEQDGEAKLKAKDYKTALAYLAMALRDAETLAPTYVDHAEYGPLYRELKAYYKDRIATVYMLMEDNPRALAMIEKAAPEYDALVAIKNTLELRERTAAVYGRLSYQQLLANQPANAKTSAKRALRLDPTQLWIKTNLAHGMLLTGEVQEAMTIYKAEQNSSLGATDERTFGQAVLDDFKEMEAAGMKSPLFDQVRKAYGASAAAPAPAPSPTPSTPPAPATPKTVNQTPPPPGPTPSVSPAPSPSPSPSASGNSAGSPKSWMQVAIVGVLVVAVFVFIALVAAALIYFDRKRTGALKSLVHSMGWTFRPNSTPADDQRISSSELSMRGRGRKLSNFIELPPGPGQPLIFDCQFTEGSGKGSRTYVQTVCCFQDERTRMLPHFLLRPEHLGDKLGSLFGGKDINFPSHPDFNSKYLLRGMNETAIRQYFTQPLLDHFDRDRGWTVEAVSGRLFVYRLAQRIKPQELQSFIDSRRKILAVITAPVTASSSSSATQPPALPSMGTVSAEADLDGDVTVRGTRPPPMPS